MSEARVEAGGGIGFLGLLAILFIGLKLGGVIDWSWIWVLCPLWGPVAIMLVVLAVAMAVIGICGLVLFLFSLSGK